MRAKLDALETAPNEEFAQKIIDENPTILKELSQAKLTIDLVSSRRYVKYYEHYTGFDELLAHDRKYCKLTKQLEQLKVIVPTPEIIEAINKYIIAMKAYACYPRVSVDLVKMHNTIGAKPLLRNVLDIDINTSSFRDHRSKSLAEVREAIDKFYRT